MGLESYPSHTLLEKTAKNNKTKWARRPSKSKIAMGYDFHLFLSSIRGYIYIYRFLACFPLGPTTNGYSLSVRNKQTTIYSICEPTYKNVLDTVCMKNVSKTGVKYASQNLMQGSMKWDS